MMKSNSSEMLFNNNKITKSNSNISSNTVNHVSLIQESGHKLTSFISEVNNDLICGICECVVRKPKECIICGNMFCDNCIKKWYEKHRGNQYNQSMTNFSNLNQNLLNFNQPQTPHSNNQILSSTTHKNELVILECPMKCKSNFKDSLFKPVGKVVKNILYQLKIKCQNSSCNEIFTLDKYEEHEFYCFLPKCNNSFCKKKAETYVTVSKILNKYKLDSGTKESRFCNENCKYSFIFQEKYKEYSSGLEINKAKEKLINTDNKNEVDNTGENNNSRICITKEDLIKWFHNFVKIEIQEKLHFDCTKRISNLKSMVKAVSGRQSLVINDNDYNPGITSFKWDSNKKGQSIQVFNNGESLMLQESCYAFRTIIGNTPFESDVHYWEIISDRRTENELKVGITRNTNFNYDTVRDFIF